MDKKRLRYHYHGGYEIPTKDSGYIYVFGSNLAGIHGRGAALIAKQRFGAEMYKGIGVMSKSYAIPTKDRFIRTLPVSEIKKYVELFKEFTFQKPDYKFWITGVGTGLAGIDIEIMATLFRGCNDNCSFPLNWKPYLSFDITDKQEPQ